MKRRDLLKSAGIGLVALAMPRSTMAQQPATNQVVFLSSLNEADPQNEIWFDAIKQGLATEGWIVGQDVVLDIRHTGASFEEARVAAEEAVAIGPDVILVVSNRLSLAVVETTSEVPVVFGLVGDPIRIGLVDNVVAPGGNATGFTISDPSIYGKRFELLQDLSPSIETVGFLYSVSADGQSVYDPLRAGIDADAAALGLALDWISVSTIEQAQSAILGFSRRTNVGLCVPSDSFNWVHRATIIETVNRTSLPAIYTWPPMAEIGGLMSYDAATEDSIGRMGVYAGRILNEVEPGTLPVQGPSQYTLALNIATAGIQGITIPTSLIAVADRIID